VSPRLAIALCATTGLLGRATVAHACGGGGGGDSSSGSSSSSSSDSGSYYSESSSTPAEPACVDASDVHGYRSCTDYGRWSLSSKLPAISFELQSWTAMVDLSDVDVSGSIQHDLGTAYSYRVVAEDVGGREALANGAKARILGHDRRGLYAGVETGFAALPRRAQSTMSIDPTTNLNARASMVYMGGIVAGYEQHLGRVTLGGEVMGGGRGVAITAESHRGACDTTETSHVMRGIIEARVRADLWVTPWITVGAYAGRDVFSAQTSAGLGVGGHLRAFDGGR
jgi:hypothetical protein